jgi:hypothetical protein
MWLILLKRALNSGARCQPTVADDRPSSRVGGGEQLERAVAFVVVRPVFGLAGAHRQHWQCTFNRLDLRLLVRQQAMVKGREIEANGVAHLHLQRTGR